MRSRNLKPGFFKSEDLASHPPLSRILFEGLWCLADSKGRLEDRPKYIKAEVLPYDDYDVDLAIDELSAQRDFGKQPFVVRYRIGDRRYLWLPGFTEHQRITGKEAEKDSLIPEYDPSVPQGNNRETTGKQPYDSQEGSGSSSCARAPLLPCTPVPLDPCTEIPMTEIPTTHTSCEVGQAVLFETPKTPHMKAPTKASDIAAIFEHWKVVMNHPRAQLDTKRKATISKALDSYTVADCLLAIDGCAKTPHNMGQNDRNERYDGIDLILRDAAHIDRFMRNAETSSLSTAPAKITDYRALDNAAEREWQRVLEAGQSNDFQKIGFEVVKLHPRTVAALKAIDKDPANAVWRMADIQIRDQLTYKAVFLPAWKASGIPYEIDGGQR